MKRMIVMLLLALLLFGPVFGFVQYRNKMIAEYFENMPTPAVAVKVEPVRSERWVHRIEAVGTLDAVNGVDISSELAGVVRTINFESGKIVKRGDLLLSLDTAVEESELESARAELKLAQSNYARTERLIKSGNVSESALDSAAADLQVRATRVEALTATIAKKRITAPFDGVLGIRRVDLGQYLEPGQVIVSLQDLSTLYGNFGVSQRELPRIAVGQQVEIRTDAHGERAFTGEVHAIEPKVDDRSGMVMVQARVPNPDGALRPGMFVRVALTLPEEEEVLTVPQMAITRSLYGDSIYVVRTQKDEAGAEKTVVERVSVEERFRRDGRVAVAAQLAAGDQVVTSGTLKLSNGTEVKPSSEDALTQAPRDLRY